MTRFHIISLLPWLLVASCAKDSASSSTESGFKPLSQRLDENNGYTQDEAGNWVPRVDKRSPYESQGASRYFDKKSNYNQKSYQAGEYARKSWWGNKDYGRKAYAGDTDGSRFRQDSKFQDRTAREAGTGNLDRPSDAETDIRRRVFPQPEIIDWREQRSLTLDQSKGILGR
jgi:hypothetical protein